MLQRLPIAAANLKSSSFRDLRYFDMSCLRILFLSAATLILLNISAVANNDATLIEPIVA